MTDLHTAQTDLDGRLAAYDVAPYAPRLPDADVSYARHECALGDLVLAVATGGRVVACSFDAEDEVAERIAHRLSPRVLRHPARLDRMRRELDDYLLGRRTSFDITVDLALASPFQRAVLESLPPLAAYGETTSYGALARALGRPRAARAVGAALRTNPCCVLVPCHRVVSTDGALTGYAGGIEAKRTLLDLEAG
ncbi:MAG TPA: methylated-DNA--[protein]-cysteine S-methyltransferase [Actinopolymorphaceae bacterium]|nr:methylated-DNA--[protein]-cysteine S-methyltransferase [Actinopolymorphaceae bacterium]